MNLATHLPPKVVSILGQEATEELLEWLTHRMQTMVGTGVNTIRLSSDGYCLPACARMVLAYLGIQ
jgi:hypothetical protein